MKKKRFWTPSARSVRNFCMANIGTYRKKKKKKKKKKKRLILNMYRLWSKCVPINLKRTPMTFQIKLTHNFGSFSITLNLIRLFSAKLTMFCVFGRIGTENLKSSKQNDLGGSFQLKHTFTTIKTRFKFPFFAFLQLPMGVCGIFRPPVGGGRFQ